MQNSGSTDGASAVVDTAKLSAKPSAAMAAIFGVFFFESVVLGNWIPRIPDIKSNLALSDATLGLCLMAMPVGTLLAFAFAARFVERFGLRRSCMVAMPVWSLSFILPGLANGLWSLFAALLVAGVSVGLIEVAMNTKADSIEQQIGKRIMSRCHGFWSLGSMAGALMGTGFVLLALSPAVHFSLTMPVIAVLGFYCAYRLPEDAPNASSDEPAVHFRLPSKAILALCLMPVGIMAVEGIFIDWSAVFVRDVLLAGPIAIGLVYSAFSLVMAVTRLSGDALTDHYGAYRVVLISGISAVLGLFVFAISNGVVMAFIGATFAGLGVAVVYPLGISAAARRKVGTPAGNVAAISLVSFTTFLLSPPLIGFLSGAFGLRTALLIFVPIAATTLLLAREVRQ